MPGKVTKIGRPLPDNVVFKPRKTQLNMGKPHTGEDGEGSSPGKRLPPTASSHEPSAKGDSPPSPKDATEGRSKTSLPNTGQPQGKGQGTGKPQMGVWTSFQGNIGGRKVIPTNQHINAGKDKRDAGDQTASPSRPHQDSPSTPPRPIATDGSQPSTMAPWDRPPLGSVPSNAWSPDDHFFSNL